MSEIELPKDAEGHEIPLDTKVLYNENGDHFDVNRFTYSVVQTIPGLKWGVEFMDCVYDYCSSFYLEPPELPDSWEKLDEDLHAAETYEDSPDYIDAACAYARNIGKRCADCKLYAGDCTVNMCTDIASRIHKLRGDGK
nr:MAG TPA: hypothetical protein [Caudoviricetes sp.]